MAFYIDTSLFVKLVVREAHSAAARRWAERHDQWLFSSDLLITEAFRTARRHSQGAVSETRSRLGVLAMIAVTTDIFERAAELDSKILRSVDALHIAAALTIGDELEAIATYDERMSESARLHGIPVVTPR
ncbi:MAG: VapC toxin family PIN domain ribonuclease [Acidobacteria bacterium]|nr:MAG: VapC toxin family PIN domain ribonuclease [Acidobacteriota bacterium]